MSHDTAATWRDQLCRLIHQNTTLIRGPRPDIWKAEFDTQIHSYFSGPHLLVVVGQSALEDSSVQVELRDLLRDWPPCPPSQLYFREAQRILGGIGAEIDVLRLFALGRALGIWQLEQPQDDRRMSRDTYMEAVSALVSPH